MLILDYNGHTATVREPPAFITADIQAALLKLARSSILAKLTNSSLPPLTVDAARLSSGTAVARNPALLQTKYGLFVTLHNKDNHDLHGCIDHFCCSSRHAFSSSFLSCGTRHTCALEISILIVPRILHFSYPDVLVDKLSTRDQGVVLTFQYQSSIYSATFLLKYGAICELCSDFRSAVQKGKATCRC